ICTSHENLLACCTNNVAGRACKPTSDVIVNCFSCMSIILSKYKAKNNVIFLCNNMLYMTKQVKKYSIKNRNNCQKERISIKRSYFMRKSITYFIGLILLFLIFIVTSWTIQIKNETMPLFDEWTRSYVDVLAGTKVYTIFRWITELGSFHVVFPLTITMMLLFWILLKDYLPTCLFG